MNPEAPYLSFRSFRKSGVAVDTPVWFASKDSSTYYLFSEQSAGKVKRIRNNRHAEIAVCDFKGGSVGTWIPCQAFLVESTEEITLAYQLLHRKYGWQMKLTDFFSRLSGRINKRAVIRMETTA